MECALSKARKHEINIMASKRAVSAVTFDVGGTLIECWPSVGHVYAEVAARHGHTLLSPALLNRRFSSAWRKFKNFRHTRSDWAALVDATFRDLTGALPSGTFFPELFERFSEADAWHVFEDVLPTLESLKSRGIRLGIISNWDDRLRPLLRRLKLDGYFETIVVSCEVGEPKPAPQLFLSACASMRCEPERTFHIGDNLKMDVQGARAAGMQALWLKRGARQSPAGTIRSLRELDKL